MRRHASPGGHTHIRAYLVLSCLTYQAALCCALQINFFCIFGLLSVWAGRHPRLGIRGQRCTARLFLGFGLVWGLVTLRNAFRFVE